MVLTVVAASACLRPGPPLLLSLTSSSHAFPIHSQALSKSRAGALAPATATTSRRLFLSTPPSVMRNKFICEDDHVDEGDGEEEEEQVDVLLGEARETTLLYSFTPLPLMFLAVLPGGTITKLLLST